jgi:hypothetical protein
MSLLPLFAIKQNTTDTIAIQHGLGQKQDTALYRDRACTQLAARWPWHYSNCPRRGQKRVMFNCYRWDLVWLN